MSATIFGRSGQEEHGFPDVPRTRGAGAVVMARCGFAGEVHRIREVRLFVRSTLTLCPALGDAALDAAVLLVSEVASNAVQHTRSGGPGGRFGVEVWHRPGTLTVAVHDEGPGERGPATRPSVRAFSPDAERGRGMAMVDVIAAEWRTLAVPGGRVVSFTLRTDADPVADLREL